MTLIESLIGVALIGVIAGSAAVAVHVGGPAVAAYVFGGALLALVALFLLTAVVHLLERIRFGPHRPPCPCERGCPARSFSCESLGRGAVWQCPCGLRYVMRAPSFGVHEVRRKLPGHERLYMRRRFWWRWRLVEGQRRAPYR
jgi:hypothetical protein